MSKLTTPLSKPFTEVTTGNLLQDLLAAKSDLHDMISRNVIALQPVIDFYNPDSMGNMQSALKDAIRIVGQNEEILNAISNVIIASAMISYRAENKCKQWEHGGKSETD